MLEHNRKTEGDKRSRLQEQEVIFLKEVVSPKGQQLQDGVFVQLAVNRSNVGILPEPNTEGVGVNTPPSEVSPAVILTMSKDDLLLRFGIYIDENGNYLAEVSAQDWTSVAYASEWERLKNGMETLFGDRDLEVKRVSILKGEGDGKPEQLRNFNNAFGTDLSLIVGSASKAASHIPDRSEFFSIQTTTGTDMNDGFYIWGKKQYR